MLLRAAAAGLCRPGASTTCHATKVCSPSLLENLHSLIPETKSFERHRKSIPVQPVLHLLLPRPRSRVLCGGPLVALLRLPLDRLLRS